MSYETPSDPHTPTPDSFRAYAHPSAVDEPCRVGGEPALSLRLPLRGQKAQLVQAELLPGRGMNLWQLIAYLPEQGLTPLIASPSLEAGARLFARAETRVGGDDFNGNLSFRHGGAILLPYANRIRGHLEGEMIRVKVNERRAPGGRELLLPANWRGRREGAEPHAMHGLFLNAAADSLATRLSTSGVCATAHYEPGDFAGHWLSRMRVEVRARLEPARFCLEVETTNVGEERAPIGIGWHPYFRIPSRQRAQARLEIPARRRAMVSNYDDVFPTGGLEPVRGTPFDFSAPDGAPLGQTFLDDCFCDLARGEDGSVSAVLTDPAARYRLEVKATSPAIRAFQVYAPADADFIALEPQFNLGDPFGREWGEEPTGMVWLAPGESALYAVDLNVSLTTDAR